MVVNAFQGNHSLKAETRNREESKTSWIQRFPKWVSLMAQMAKNLPAVQEIWVPFLGQEDPLEKGMATHSNIFAWEISWTEEPGGLQSMGSQKFEYD